MHSQIVVVFECSKEQGVDEQPWTGYYPMPGKNADADSFEQAAAIGPDSVPCLCYPMDHGYPDQCCQNQGLLRELTHPLYWDPVDPLALLLLAPLLRVCARHPLCKEAQLALDLNTLQTSHCIAGQGTIQAHLVKSVSMSDMQCRKRTAHTPSSVAQKS